MLATQNSRIDYVFPELTISLARLFWKSLLHLEELAFSQYIAYGFCQHQGRYTCFDRPYV